MKIEFTEKQAEEFLNEKALSQSEVNQRLKCTHQPINFHGSVLMNLDLSNRKINNVNFAGIFMQNINFQNTDFTSTSFYGTIMENINFEGSDLSTSDFSQTKIKNCNFKSVKASLSKRIYFWFKNET